MWMTVALSVAALGLLPTLASADVLSLSDLSWSLKNQNGSIVIPGKVPSQAHLDLLEAGIITEPLLGINGRNWSCSGSNTCLTTSIADFTQRWIVNDNWTYTADLTPFSNKLTNETTALLVFYGIDTIANIVSNLAKLHGVWQTEPSLQTVAGHPVAWVNNEYRQYVYDVTDHILAPVNNDTNLTVALESAWYYGLNVSSRPDLEPPVAIDVSTVKTTCD